MKYKILNIRTGTSTSNREPEIPPSFKYLRNKISVKRLFTHSILTAHPGSWVEECRSSVRPAFHEKDLESSISVLSRVLENPNLLWEIRPRSQLQTGLGVC